MPEGGAKEAAPLRVGLVQEGPAYLDLKGCLAKFRRLLFEAVAGGAGLVVFGECWLGGYPVWVDHLMDYARWGDPDTQDLYSRTLDNAISLGTPEFDSLASTVREAKSWVVLGANERVRGSLYIAIFIFNPEGELVVHHRKLVPTYTERLIYGHGDAAGLRTAKTEHGGLGALVCWEHWMPTARQALHTEGESLHVSLWPSVSEMHQVASRHYAFEGRCFVLAVGQVITKGDLPADIQDRLAEPARSAGPGHQLMTGGSCVYGPEGEVILPPQHASTGIFLVDLPDVAVRCRRAGLTLDVTGHYARPDLFDMNVRRGRRGRAGIQAPSKL